MKIDQSRERDYLFLIFVLLVPVIIYFYFLEWRTETIYGDDLYLYRQFNSMESFSDKLNLPVSAQKLRPVHGFSLQLIIDAFQKNVHAYFFFNVFIQAVNTLLFARICNIFIKSRTHALFFALVVGLSRFAFFNITQLFNGGALEGLAMSFFLAAVYYFIIAVKGADESQRYRNYLLALLFSNLSIYTHERYIALLLFSIFLLLFFNGVVGFSLKKRIFLLAASILSIFINVYIKKSVFGMPFFVGTGGTQIEFSFATTWLYFVDSLSSMLSLNKGEEYLSGVSVNRLTLFPKILAFLVAFLQIGLLIRFVWERRKSLFKSRLQFSSDISFLILALALFFLFLLPAVINFRLEQRWLQASFAVQLIIFVFTLFSSTLFSTQAKRYLLVLFTIIFLWVELAYLKAGSPSTYLKNAERIAKMFKSAAEDSLIKSTTDEIYVWEEKQDLNRDNTIAWSIGEGYLFDFYGYRNKEVLFLDSLYDRNYNFQYSRLPDFDSSKNQILYLGYQIYDITEGFRQDSLKHFVKATMPLLQNNSGTYYPQHEFIESKDFAKYTTEGFYEDINDVRWTSGKASIGFKGDVTLKNSVLITLDTYLPPICDSIFPEVMLIGTDSTLHKAIGADRRGDKFFYKFYFEQQTYIHKIKIDSDTIPNQKDGKSLSFPFISIEIASEDNPNSFNLKNRNERQPK